jgi:cytochrome c5
MARISFENRISTRIAMPRHAMQTRKLIWFDRNWGRGNAAGFHVAPWASLDGRVAGQITMKARILLCAVLLAAPGACHRAPPAPTPEQAAKLAPSDPALAGLYLHSCKACHAVPGTGAPLVHDHAAWDPRWDKGESVLLAHTIEGFRAMPAGGQCAACTTADYEKLTRFLADREDGK